VLALSRIIQASPETMVEHRWNISDPWIHLQLLSNLWPGIEETFPPEPRIQELVKLEAA